MTAGLLPVHGYNEPEMEFCDLEKYSNRKYHDCSRDNQTFKF